MLLKKMMSFSVLGLVLASSVPAMACELQEAQFIAKVKYHYDVQMDEVNRECFFNLEFVQLNPSAECPLDSDDVSSAEFWDYACKYENGDQLSGVIGEKNGQVFIESNSK